MFHEFKNANSFQLLRKAKRLDMVALAINNNPNSLA